ncbi:MAG TPA: hypothetical protein QGH35_06265, partial [Gammaproteobacteria bacterium]|nr:hypothetical protein [Gammaproteobacteria bacterium]
MNKIKIIASLILLHTTIIFSHTDGYDGQELSTNKIDEQHLHQHIQILASDEFEGRAPGSEGGEKTKEYLV